MTSEQTDNLTPDERRKRAEFLLAASLQLRKDLNEGMVTLARYRAELERLARTTDGE